MVFGVRIVRLVRNSQHAFHKLSLIKLSVHVFVDQSNHALNFRVFQVVTHHHRQSFLHLVMVHTEWDGVESGHLRRKTCELLLSLNTTSAEIPTITLQLTEEAESLSQQMRTEAVTRPTTSPNGKTTRYSTCSRR